MRRVSAAGHDPEDAVVVLGGATTPIAIAGGKVEIPIWPHSHIADAPVDAFIELLHREHLIHPRATQNDPPEVLPVLQRALEAGTGIGLHALEGGGAGEALEHRVPGSLDAGTRDGIVYTLPMQYNSYSLFINNRLFEEAGLDPVAGRAARSGTSASRPISIFLIWSCLT